MKQHEIYIFRDDQKKLYLYTYNFARPVVSSISLAETKESTLSENNLCKRLSVPRNLKFT